MCKVTQHVLFLIAFPLTMCWPDQSGSLTRQPRNRINDFQKLTSVRVPFIANEGQVHSNVKFYASAGPGTVFVTAQGKILYAFPTKPASGQPAFADLLTSHTPTRTGLAVEEELVGATINKITGESQSACRVSYFRGGDPALWQSAVLTFQTVSLGEVYDGIELKLRVHVDNVEKLFYINPGSDPSDILIRVNGVCPLRTNQSGELEILSDSGTLVMTSPVAYQEIAGRQREVEVAYLPEGNTYSFRVGDYDKTKPLIVDPMLASTFVGGSDGEEAWPCPGLAVSMDGFIYVAASSLSPDYPVTAGAYQTNYQGGGIDIVVSKFDPSLTTLLASTFLGGSSRDEDPSIVIDADGNIFITGETMSSDFPTTAGAFMESYGGHRDVFVAKLSGDLATLLTCTYLGGSTIDRNSNITVNSLGEVFVAGQTTSADYPITEGAFDQTRNADYDVFVSKLSGDLSTLIASTFVGTGCTEDHSVITLDQNDNPIITGSTESSSFPTTAGVYQETFGGGLDIYVTKLNSNLESLLASTFIGSSGFEMGYGLAVSSGGYVYVVSHPTGSYPTTPGAYQTAFGGGVADAGVAKLDSNLTALLASTYIGGNANDNAVSVAVDSDGSVIVSGYTDSPDFPIMGPAIDSNFNGGTDGFISKLSPNLDSLKASTFLGGSSFDDADAVAISIGGQIVVAGSTSSGNFPVTSTAYDDSFNGNGDIFAATLAFSEFTRITEGPQVNDSCQSTGVCWIDYDDDGYLDIYLVNGGLFLGGDPQGQSNCLFRNRADGTFEKVSGQPVVTDQTFSESASWADFDNDGDLDVILANSFQYENVLYLNDGYGNLATDDNMSLDNDTCMSSAGNWVDYDLDGDLDLFIANNTTRPAFGDYPLYKNFLFRNDDGVLTQIHTGSLVTDMGHSYGSTWSDFDNDGDPDVVMANNGGNIDLYRNEGDGTFSHMSESVVCQTYNHSVSTCWSDYDNDGDMDLLVPDFSSESHFFENNGDGTFTSILDNGLAEELEYCTGGVWADYDNDGDQDMFAYFRPEYSTVRGALFENMGDKSFARVTEGSIAEYDCSAQAAAWADYDRDGDMDLYITQYDTTWTEGMSNILFRNDGNSNNWITIKPIGTRSNRSAIGTKVHLLANVFGYPVRQMRELRSLGSGHVQSPLEAHFGLGDAYIVDSIIVEWPSGIVQTLTGVSVNQYYKIIENCCVGHTGNVDNDPSDGVDLGDLTALIDYLFISFTEPECMTEANVDGDLFGQIDLGDLTALIDFLFISFAPTAECE